MLRLTEEQFAARNARRGDVGMAEVDHFAPENLPPARERDVLAAVLKLLAAHPKVAFAFRASAGTFLTLDGKRHVSVGFRGLADIAGALRDGRWLAIEAKSSAGRVSDEQAAFLDAVRAIGGVAVVARSVDDVMAALA